MPKKKTPPLGGTRTNIDDGVSLGEAGKRGTYGEGARVLFLQNGSFLRGNMVH